MAATVANGVYDVKTVAAFGVERHALVCGSGSAYDVAFAVAH